MGALARKTAPLVAALMLTFGVAAVAEEGKYPDWKGQWNRQRVPGVAGQPSFDPNKPWGKGQQAPLTPEYQAVLEANLQAQRDGGFFDWLGASCRGFGMPLVMYASSRWNSSSRRRPPMCWSIGSSTPGASTPTAAIGPRRSSRR
jgi:hypothetical protein